MNVVVLRVWRDTGGIKLSFAVDGEKWVYGQTDALPRSRLYRNAVAMVIRRKTSERKRG